MNNSLFSTESFIQWKWQHEKGGEGRERKSKQKRPVTAKMAKRHEEDSLKGRRGKRKNHNQWPSVIIHHLCLNSLEHTVLCSCLSCCLSVLSIRLSKFACSSSCCFWLLPYTDTVWCVMMTEGRSGSVRSVRCVQLRDRRNGTTVIDDFASLSTTGTIGGVVFSRWNTYNHSTYLSLPLSLFPSLSLSYL